MRISAEPGAHDFEPDHYDRRRRGRLDHLSGPRRRLRQRQQHGTSDQRVGRRRMVDDDSGYLLHAELVDERRGDEGPWNRFPGVRHRPAPPDGPGEASSRSAAVADGVNCPVVDPTTSRSSGRPCSAETPEPRAHTDSYSYNSPTTRTAFSLKLLFSFRPDQRGQRAHAFRGEVAVYGLRQRPSHRRAHQERHHQASIRSEWSSRRPILTRSRPTRISAYTTFTGIQAQRARKVYTFNRSTTNNQDGSDLPERNPENFYAYDSNGKLVEQNDSGQTTYGTGFTVSHSGYHRTDLTQPDGKGHSVG